MSESSKVIRGGFWTALSTAFTMLTQFGRVAILTRFLERSDFGVVSIINMILSLCFAFSDLGFASIIMYKEKLSDREFSSIYWVQWIIYIVVYFLIAISSPLISSFYQESILTILIPISALSLICLSFGKLYDSVLQKRYEFKKLAIRNIISNVLSFLLAIWLAYKGYGVYSLIYSTLFQALLYNSWTFIIGYSYQPVKFIFNLTEVMPLIKMGLYQTYTRVADFLSSKIDVLIIGKMLGMDVLGLYDLSKELVLKFVTFIRSVVSQIALPYISNSNTEDSIVKNKFLIVSKLVALICIPICCTIFVFSEEFLSIVYGSKYVDASLIVSVFALVSIATSITSFFDMLGIAKGRTDLNFKNTIYRIIVTTPIIAIASLFSINILAIAQIPITLIMVMIFWKTVVNNTYPLSFKVYFSQFKWILVITLCVSIVFRIVKSINCIPFDNYYLKFVVYLFSYSITLLLAYFMFLKEDIFFLKRIIIKKKGNK